MDENMSGKMTVLEEIMSDVAKALFQRWANGLPEDQRGEEALAVLNRSFLLSFH